MKDLYPGAFGRIIKRKGDFEKILHVREFLKSELNLLILKSVEPGVLAAKMCEGTEELAVRIVKTAVVCKREITEWPRIKHTNVLKLLNVQHVPQFDVYVFITKNHPFSLKTALRKDELFKCPRTNYIQRWLREILSALQYLHDKRNCHLSLCLKNVLISSEFSVVMRAPSKRYDVPLQYRTPETHLFQEKISVDGVPFDLWCFGILTVKLFTRNNSEHYKCLLRTSSYWWKDVYNNLYETLQQEAFHDTIRRTFPKSQIDGEQKESMRNFVTSCLKWRPEERPSAERLMQHKYLAENGYLGIPDGMWENDCYHSTVGLIHREKSRMARTKVWFKKKCRRLLSKLASCMS